MPKTKAQGVLFGLIMSYAMAYGMEIYNVAIKEGVHMAAGGLSNMSNLVFWDALKEASAALGYFNPEVAGSKALTGCDLHPGAARYYQEMGYAFE